MVAMQVADEDVIQPRELEFHAPHFKLGALAAVNHEQVVANVQHLARRQVLKTRRCRSASQYVQFKSCHAALLMNCDHEVTQNFTINQVLDPCTHIIFVI